MSSTNGAPHGRLLNTVLRDLESRWLGRHSYADAFKVKNPGRIAEKTAAEFDDPLSDSPEVSDLGLLERCNQLSKPVVEGLLLVSRQVV